MISDAGGQGGAHARGRQGRDGRRQPRVVGSARWIRPTRSSCARSPLHAPEFALGPDGTRKFPTAGSLSVLVPPGTYTVKLVAGGVERTAPLTVRKDPNTAGTEEDVAAQTKVLLAIRGQRQCGRADDQHGRVRPRAARRLAGADARRSGRAR